MNGSVDEKHVTDVRMSVPKTIGPTRGVTPFSFVIGVSDDEILRQNFLASPCLTSAGSLHQVILVRDGLTTSPRIVFGDLRGHKLRSDRNAAAVDHHHALRTFPTTGLADSGAPFFAVTKAASEHSSVAVPKVPCHTNCLSSSIGSRAAQAPEWQY